MTANIHLEPNTLPKVVIYEPTENTPWEFIQLSFDCRYGGSVDIFTSREDLAKAARSILAELNLDHSSTLSAKLSEMAKAKGEAE